MSDEATTTSWEPGVGGPPPPEATFRQKLADFHLKYRVAPADRVEQLIKRWRDKDGNWKEAGPFDYVGHANATDVLLFEDPDWDWEPASPEFIAKVYGPDQGGAMRFSKDGWPTGLWITMTLHGKQREGYGSCPPGKPDAVKELIGDAIRNAAMRFGLALDLWGASDRAIAHAEGEAPPAPQGEAKPVQPGQCPECYAPGGRNHATSCSQRTATAPTATPAEPQPGGGPGTSEGQANGAAAPAGPGAVREDLARYMKAMKGETVNGYIARRKQLGLPEKITDYTEEQAFDLWTWFQTQPVARVATPAT